MNSEDLAGLLARCGLHDQIALRQLYSLTSPKLFGVALRILRRRDWAEEVLQESYVSIWNHAQRYDAARSAPMTWMTAIVRNRALDWLRRPREETVSEERERMFEEIADEAPGPDELLQRSTDAAALADCLRGLSSGERQSITLAYYFGLSHLELAAHLREPLGTVKTWIRRGLERLRGCMGGEMES
jgi:RNA polymerase sigma-70 factor (ECF subfamily)